MKFSHAGLVVLLTLVGATVASAQSLGDVARQEEARRKAITSPGKVYTNDSLRTVPESIPPPPTRPAGPEAATPSASEPQAQSGSKAAPPADEPKRPADEAAKDEAAWRKRMDDARATLARAQTFHDALQNQINSLAADFVNRDDPVQRAKIASDRQKALVELDRLKLEIQKDQKAIADIQEEARRAGVPAGWVR